ncbi:MAG: HNH endonuclease [Actinomycetia bacterium]|nr:HNH endonuclease [Actinomycetes bacterium]
MLDVPQEPPIVEPSGNDVPADMIPFGEEPVGPVEVPVEPVFDGVPPGLDAMEPGPVLAGWLSSIDVSEISGLDRVILLRAHQRMASHYHAQMYADMTAVADAIRTDVYEPVPDPQDAAEAAAAEIRVALHLTCRTSDIEMSFALGLKQRLPRLADMLAAGLIDIRRAKGIDRATTHLSDSAAQAVLDRIADDVPELTTGQIMARIRRLCIEVDIDDAERRFDQAVGDRRISAEATESGTANLVGVDLPPDRVAAAMDRINAIAKSLRTRSELRTMDQLRADVYLDLLDGTDLHTVGRGVVDILVDLETLTGLKDHPGELAGYGPVIADVARHMVDHADDAQWRVTATDLRTGLATHTVTTTRRPTAAQRRRIQTRDHTCVFPGCRRPARQSDIDHMLAVEDGGPTSDTNLAPLCRHDHRIKHAYGWLYLRIVDGRYQWTTRLGQVVTTFRTHSMVSARPPPRTRAA